MGMGRGSSICGQSHGIMGGSRGFKCVDAECALVLLPRLTRGITFCLAADTRPRWTKILH